MLQTSRLEINAYHESQACEIDKCASTFIHVKIEIINTYTNILV